MKRSMIAVAVGAVALVGAAVPAVAEDATTTVAPTTTTIVKRAEADLVIWAKMVNRFRPSQQ